MASFGQIIVVTLFLLQFSYAQITTIHSGPNLQPLHLNLQYMSNCCIPNTQNTIELVYCVQDALDYHNTKFDKDDQPIELALVTFTTHDKLLYSAYSIAINAGNQFFQ